ncbi:MAG: tRNA 5-methoxyuridine(34)/uridine 5-oxyacetic acid(34) synthase CmoB [Myxococcales bacterium]|nr:tRNA 5-methoxyuridine(34)/uridine 5-oxyacetic acid(34) synthase CmoB [Myxococcales bacterium]
MQTPPNYRGYLPPDYLEQFDFTDETKASIRALRQEHVPLYEEPRLAAFRDAAYNTRDIRPSQFELNQSSVSIGRPEDLSEEQQQRLQAALQTFCPWKKGPFTLYGTEIDAEWRSDWKWDRVAPLASLEGKRVADIGCHNGYFMFRMAHQSPACVIGFEPYAKHYWAFQLLQQWTQLPNLHFELLGVEQTDLFPSFFDVIYCLGILYHHTDPIGLLRKMRQALAPKGEIIIDCQGVPGDEPVALMPRRRYAKARGIWFLPTQSCLEHWIWRAGFKDVQCFFAAPLSTEEQRRTSWADVESLADFLDPEDPNKTVEGYPAPWRFYIYAKRG